MKLLPLRMRKNNRNKLNSLPYIRKDYSMHNISEISYNNSNNNVSITTKVSLSKNNSTSLITSHKLKIPKKIHLNKSLGNNEKNIFYYPLTSNNNNTLKLIEKADDIIKKRKSSNLYVMEGGLNFSRKYIIGKSKEISKKNYAINHLRQERTEINSKNFYMDQVIKDFDTQFNKDYNDFLKFISVKEEDVLEKVMKIRKKTESILHQEQTLNDSLIDLLIKRVKSFYVLQKFGSFFHELIERPFLYSQVKNNYSEKSDFESISDKIINIYETKEKYLTLPKELNDDSLIDNKYAQLEEMILSMIGIKVSLEKEINNDIKNYDKELKLVKIIKSQYEKDLDFIKAEKFLMYSGLRKNSVHNYEFFDDILKYISELGKELKVKGNTPEKVGENSYEFVNYAKKALKILEGMETRVNELIGNIENIEQEEIKNNESIMKEILINQKNLNKMNIKLSFQQMQEKKKLIKDKQTMKKGKKWIIRRRLVFNFSNPKRRKKIKKVIIRKDNDEDDLYYSDSETEKTE